MISKLSIKKDMDRLLSAKGLLLKDLYASTGINSTTLNDLRNKNDCKVSQLQKICSVLNVPITAFVRVDNIDCKENEKVNFDVNSETDYGLSNGSYLNEIKLLKQVIAAKDLLLEEKDKRLKLLEK